MRVSKQGSTLAGIMDAFAISLSHGLQYGVPLGAFCRAFVGMRFEPAGITDDRDIRIATSLMDYLFRKLAVMYLTQEERSALGIYTAGERIQPTLPGVEEHAVKEVANAAAFMEGGRFGCSGRGGAEQLRQRLLAVRRSRCAVLHDLRCGHAAFWQLLCVLLLRHDQRVQANRGAEFHHNPWILTARRISTAQPSCV